MQKSVRTASVLVEILFYWGSFDDFFKYEDYAVLDDRIIRTVPALT
jgi:hypothetical protein